MAELREYDGIAVGDLARRSGAASVRAFDVVESTMDAAHALARDGAEHGTVVLADTQRTGRGRERREWQSPAGGVWFTVLLRTVQPASLGVLPLRIGLAAGAALDPLAGERVGLKWPNDLFVAGGKLGGVLVEARWHGAELDWVAAGVGVNLEAAPVAGSAALGASARRAEVAALLIPAILEAAYRTGELTDGELSAFASRDIVRGRAISAPVSGVVSGLSSAGALLVDVDGTVREIRSGSIVLRERTPQESANGQRPMANS